MVEIHNDDSSTVITLLPNRSASWQETRVFVVVICCTTLIIGVLLAVIGAWPVLPFSGLEAALVAYLFYRVCQATYQRQVITCTATSVQVQFGTHFPKRTWVLQRDRTRLAVMAAEHALTPPRLVIADPSNSIELGMFLNKDDKQLALEALRNTGLPVRAAGASTSRDF